MALSDTIGSRVTGAYGRLSDLYWERRLGIRTAGSKSIPFADAERYVSLHYPAVLATLRGTGLRSSDIFADVGCGKGRVICCAATMNVKEVIGIEVDAELCDAARANIAGMRGRKTTISVVQSAAQDFDYRGITVLWLFNPFGAATMGAVLGAIRQSLSDNPRELRIIYANCVHDGVLAAEHWLERYDLWNPHPWTSIRFPVSFWRTRSQ